MRYHRDDFLDSGGLGGRMKKIMDDAEDCRRACFRQKDCTGFTFFKHEMNKDNCALAGVGAKQYHSSCCDSGEVSNGCRRTFAPGIIIPFILY